MCVLCICVHERGDIEREKEREREGDRERWRGAEAKEGRKRGHRDTVRKNLQKAHGRVFAQAKG